MNSDQPPSDWESENENAIGPLNLVEHENTTNIYDQPDTHPDYFNGDSAIDMLGSPDSPLFTGRARQPTSDTPPTSDSDIDEPFPDSDGDTALLTEQEADSTRDLNSFSFTGPASSYPDSEDDVPISRLIRRSHTRNMFSRQRRITQIMPSVTSQNQLIRENVPNRIRSSNTFLGFSPVRQHRNPPWWNTNKCCHFFACDDHKEDSDSSNESFESVVQGRIDELHNIRLSPAIFPMYVDDLILYITSENSDCCTRFLNITASILANRLSDITLVCPVSLPIVNWNSCCKLYTFQIRLL